MKRVHVYVSGRVQGVFFRAETQRTATGLKLNGWVRNMDDGSVTMEMQGQEAPVAALEKRIRQGNAFIGVKELTMEEREPIAAEERFQIRY